MGDIKGHSVLSESCDSMKPRQTHVLNLVSLEDQLREQDLKIWWVAETIGVNRKTVSRWLNGQVRRISARNLAALADCLQCRPPDLVLSDASDQLASNADQTRAARSIIDENLLATLAPAGKWSLLEHVIKATMQPNLPLPLLGRLYNYLSIAAWRQSKIETALGYAEKAMELADKLQSKSIKVNASYNIALIYSLQGRIGDSLRLNHYCLQHHRFLDETVPLGGILCNTGIAYHEFGDFDRAVAYFNQSIDALQRSKEPMRRSIAWCALGLVYSETGQLESAAEALTISLKQAEAGGYLRGIHACHVYLAEIYARQQELARARQSYSKGMAGFAAIELQESHNSLVGAVLERCAGNLPKAFRHINDGLELAKPFPIQQAALLTEQAGLFRIQHNELAAKAALVKAREIYRSCSAELRLQRLDAILRDRLLEHTGGVAADPPAVGADSPGEPASAGSIED